MKKEKKEGVKRNNKITIKVKEFPSTSKSRKGKYYYIKEQKKPARYYKYKGGVKPQDFLKIYKTGGLRSKKGGVTTEKVNKRKITEKQLKQYPQIDTVLQSGYAENTIRNADKLTSFGIRTAYMDLLRNRDKKGDGHGIVRDKELLELITMPDNVEKWKHRVLYEIGIYNDKQELLGMIVTNSTKGLNDIKREVIDTIKVGMEYSSQYKTIGSLSDKGYNVQAGITKQGKINELKIKMIFRKGK